MTHFLPFPPKKEKEKKDSVGNERTSSVDLELMEQYM